MNVRCPTCGADVEFRYDDSFVRVCDHCRSAVLRTDRGPETLGKFADLIPIPSQLKLFAEGRYQNVGFQLIGMAQLRHASGGVWQEWYAKLDGDKPWGWLSEAQGRIYFTFERPDVKVPSIAQLAPGTQIQIAGAPFTVAERGTATYVSALGEIPYRLAPQTTFQFVDLSDGRGGFATIDYNDGSAEPTVYLGYQVTPQGLGISGGETAAPAVAPVQAARLACPNCNGSLELRAPDATLRIACSYCGTLISVENGALSIIAKQSKKPKLAIPLGTKGTFADGELTVIGYFGRSAYADGSWWPFEEYLLYAPNVGFRWLVSSDGHWSYVQPVASGAVKQDGATHQKYDGVAFKRFFVAELRVDLVLGECYWRVQVGERVQGEDYIAPPAMLSREASKDEQNWSLSSYLTRDDVDRAFGKKLGLPPPRGVGANQPYPAGLGKISAALLTALCAVAIGKCASAPAKEQLRQRFTVPMLAKPAPDAVASDEPAGSVMFSDKFTLTGGSNVEVELSAGVNNNWLYGAFDLVNEDTNGVVTFDKSIEYYSGVDGGESWSEGSPSETQVLGPVEAGTYTLRVEAQHGGVGNVDLRVVVRQGVFRFLWFFIAAGVLGVPLLFVAWHAGAFRKQRWENSNQIAHSSGGDDDDDDD